MEMIPAMSVTVPEKYRTIVADGALLVVAAIWGGGFIAAKEALMTIPPLGLLMSRFLLSALVMLIVFHRVIIKHHTKKDMFFGVIVGVIQFIAFNFQLQGLNLTTVEKHSFLITSYVIFVPFLSWVATRHAIGRKDVVCAILAMIGMAFLCLKTGESLSFSLGDILSVMAALCFSAQIVFVGNFVKGANMISMSFFQLATLGILGIPFAGLDSVMQMSMPSLYGLLYLVFFNTALAFSMQNVAQQYTSDAHASLCISFESVFGFIFAVLFYGSMVTPLEITGCLLILAAILGANMKNP